MQKHIDYVLGKRFIMGIFDSVLVKYGVHTIGQAILGLPVFGPDSENYNKRRGEDKAGIMKDLVRNNSLLINMAKSIGRIVISYKDVQSIAGYTALIYEMEQVLSDLSNSKYKRVMI